MLKDNRQKVEEKGKSDLKVNLLHTLSFCISYAEWPSSLLGRFTLRKKLLVPFGYENGWAPVSVSMRWRRWKPPALHGIEPRSSVLQPSYYTELFRLRKERKKKTNDVTETKDAIKKKLEVKLTLVTAIKMLFWRCRWKLLEKFRLKMSAISLQVPLLFLSWADYKALFHKEICITVLDNTCRTPEEKTKCHGNVWPIKPVRKRIALQQIAATDDRPCILPNLNSKFNQL
jgi:hypothetical protein